MKDFSQDLLEKASMVQADVYQLAFYSKTGASITYPDDNQKPQLHDPSSEERRTILYAFQEEGAIEIKYEYLMGRRQSPYKWLFTAIPSKLSDLREGIQKLYLLKGKAKSLSEGNKEFIEEWLARKSQNFIDTLWPVVSEIQTEAEITGKSDLKIPIERFKNSNIDLENAKKLLAQLHGKKIINVMKVIGKNSDETASMGIPITDDEEIFYHSNTEMHIARRFSYLYSALALKQHPTKDINNTGQHIDSIVENFTVRNIPFVLMVLEKIVDVIEVAPVGTAYYTLQSSSGTQQLVYERQLLRKLEAIGLFRKGEEDGIWGSSPITQWDLPLIKKCIERMGALLHQDNPGGDVEVPIEGKLSPAKKDQFYSCGKLIIDKKRATIKYGEQEAIDISPENREITFFIMLSEANGEVVKYIDIVTKLNLKAVRSADTNEDFARDVQFLRRDLGIILKKAGMTSADIQLMIRTVRKTGYQLRCVE